MVNVGGRSKGCHNCKRRRIACDQARPSCNRCHKSGLVCEGYKQSAVFVYEDPKAKSERRLIRAAAQDRTRVSSPLAIPQSLHPRSLPTVEDYAQITYMFRSFHLSDEKALAYRWPDQTWLVEKDPSSAVALGIRAVAATFYGRMHAHEASTMRGTALYIQALKALHRDLSRGDEYLDMTHVMAAMNFGMHEMALPTSATGWLKHIQGIRRMISPPRFKPEMFADGPAKAVFKRTRSALAVQGMLDRRRTFLEEEEWRTVPWAADPESKSFLDQIVDVLCFLPGLFEDEDTMVAMAQEGDDSAAYKLFRATFAARITSLLILLYRLRWIWEYENPFACYEVPEPPSSPFAPTVISFNSLIAANEVVLYNANLLLLLELAEDHDIPIPDGASFVPDYAPLPPPTNPLRLPGDGDSSEAAAREICRCAQFHLGNPMNLAAHHFMLFPLATARRKFKTAPAESLWVKELLEGYRDGGVFEAEIIAR